MRLSHVAPAMLAALFALFALPASAQSFRAYLASYGNDANPCTIASPCRLLPAALNAVLDGGEVWILDSANFNQTTVHIQKSVSILGVPGQVASIVAASGGPAIVLDPVVTLGPPPSIRVALRNVAIVKNTNNPGTDGVVVTNGADLSVEDSLFANLAGAGITASNTVSVIHARNSVFRNITGNAITVTGGPTADVTNSQLLSTGGVAAASTASGTTTVSVTDSTISGGNIGVSLAASAGNALAFIVRSTIQGMALGIDAEASGQGAARATMGGSALVGNTTGFFLSGAGSIRSNGNNTVDANGTSTGGFTNLPPQ